MKEMTLKYISERKGRVIELGVSCGLGTATEVEVERVSTCNNCGLPVARCICKKTV